MHNRFSLFPILILLLLQSCAQGQQNCDIVIVGGTLAALGAVIHAPDYYKTCLIEPTSRLGGQLGDEGVWHIDFNWLYQKDYPDRNIAYSSLNIHPFLNEIVTKCNTGDCWVSRNCFQYSCIEPLIKEKLSNKPNLTIFWDSTVKSVQRAGSRVTSLEMIQRLPLASNAREDCRYFSESVEDWYTRQPSQYHRKIVTRVNVSSFVIEASQYGDVLVLSNASYLQGTANKSTCGQSTVFGFQQVYTASQHTSTLTSTISQHQIANTEEDGFSLAGYTAEQVWRYRRLVGSGIGIKPKQISLQNWNGPGNDYKGGYLFIDANTTRWDWKGGLNFTTLKQAQLRALRFHAWFKQVSNISSLDLYKNQTKTCLGTTRLPYVRDGRRSIGYKGFFMVPEDVTGSYTPGGSLTGTVFPDRIAIGMYNMDLHSINNCTYGTYAQNYPLPFFLPIRAFSNSDIENMITSGRAMAQQFFVSSATRTHATELASGSAAMIMAIYMRSTKIPSMWALINSAALWPELRQFVRQVMPIQWTINGCKYPDSNSISEQLLTKQTEQLQ